MKPRIFSTIDEDGINEKNAGLGYSGRFVETLENKEEKYITDLTPFDSGTEICTKIISFTDGLTPVLCLKLKRLK